MSEIERLKACPFCAHDAALIPVAFPKSIRFTVECVNHACHVRTPQFSTEAEAIKAWNTRAPDPSLQSKLAEAERALEPAAKDVLEERKRQVSEEGWTPEHDDGHDIDYSLARAAAAYAYFNDEIPAAAALASSLWPWHRQWWKPSSDRRRNLVKAGALILAEIKRLDRLATIREEEPLPAKEGQD